ncbi:MAG: ABC transporter ATP-binding protein [Pseudomonadota bacterium]
MSHSIRLDNVSRAFGPVRAVHGMSFEIERGEMFALIGPDGAGKTTTLKMILGLLPSDSGRIETLGLSPERDRLVLAEKVGYLPQRFSLYGDLSVDENISFFATIHGVGHWRSRRAELLKMMRLDPFRTRLADRLSGGMKQKLALCCTLIHTPELLILDEPTTGVDPVSRREFWAILSGLKRDGITIVLTTPYLDEAERVDRVALMMKGRLLDLDTPARLRASVRGSVIEVLARPKREAADLLRRIPGVSGIETFGERLHAAVPDLSGEAAETFGKTIEGSLRSAGVVVTTVRAVAPTLEDLFISRVRNQETGEEAVP